VSTAPSYPRRARLVLVGVALGPTRVVVARGSLRAQEMALRALLDAAEGGVQAHAALQVDGNACEQGRKEREVSDPTVDGVHVRSPHQLRGVLKFPSSSRRMKRRNRLEFKIALAPPSSSGCARTTPRVLASTPPPPPRLVARPALVPRELIT